MARKNPKQSVENQDSLYVSLEDPKTKRKNILHSLKHSLIMQEEAEKIKEIRSQKVAFLHEIKKDVGAIQEKYAELKKVLPNVKTTLSMTEKEIEEMERHINSLRTSVENEKSHIKEEEQTKKGLEKVVNKKRSKDEIVYGNPSQKDSSKSKKNNFVSSSTKKSIGKRDRIKNNLDVIEERLKKL